MMSIVSLSLFSLSRARTHTHTHPFLSSFLRSFVPSFTYTHTCTHTRTHPQTRIFTLTLDAFTAHANTHLLPRLISPTLTALRASRCRRCGGAMDLVRRRRTDRRGPTLGCSLGRRRLRRSPSLRISESILQSETTPEGCHCAYSQASGGPGSCGLNHTRGGVSFCCAGCCVGGWARVQHIARLTIYTTRTPPSSPYLTPPQIPHTGRAAFGVVAGNGEQCGNLVCAVVAFETRYVGERSE